MTYDFHQPLVHHQNSVEAAPCDGGTVPRAITGPQRHPPVGSAVVKAGRNDAEDRRLFPRAAGKVDLPRVFAS